MEKIYVRKCERYTVWEASQPIEVNIEKLKQCEPPFEGETEQDLLEYLRDNVYRNYDWASDNEDVYGEEAYDLTFDECYDMEVYDDSRNKYSQEWMDVGLPDAEYRRVGGFNIIATNVDES